MIKSVDILHLEMTIPPVAFTWKCHSFKNSCRQKNDFKNLKKFQKHFQYVPHLHKNLESSLSIRNDDSPHLKRIETRLTINYGAIKKSVSSNCHQIVLVPFLQPFCVLFCFDWEFHTLIPSASKCRLWQFNRKSLFLTNNWIGRPFCCKWTKCIGCFILRHWQFNHDSLSVTSLMIPFSSNHSN